MQVRHVRVAVLGKLLVVWERQPIAPLPITFGGDANQTIHDRG